jgi:hypothetical protein
MDKEYVIWGIAPNCTEENILYTKAQSEEEARQAMAILTKHHNCKNCRLQIVDLSPGYNSAKDFTKAIKGGK